MTKSKIVSGLELAALLGLLGVFVKSIAPKRELGRVLIWRLRRSPTREDFDPPNGQVLH